MNRKDFIKKSLLGTGAVITGSTIANKLSTNEPETIGFNHIQNTNSKIMKIAYCTKRIPVVMQITAG